MTEEEKQELSAIRSYNENVRADLSLLSDSELSKKRLEHFTSDEGDFLIVRRSRFSE